MKESRTSSINNFFTPFKKNPDIIPMSPQTLINPNKASVNSHSQFPSIKLSSKLSNLIEVPNDLGFESKVITLFSSIDGGMHSHDEALEVFQKYENYQIVFIGIWGSLDCDKDYFYNKILELCEIKGQQYIFNSVQTKINSLVTFYQRPFIKENLRIFLLNCKGYENPSQLTKIQKMQLDVLMAFCQCIFLVEKTEQLSANMKPMNVIQIGYKHFNDSFKRLYLEKGLSGLEVSEFSWPKNLIVLFDSSDSIKKHSNIDSYEEELQKNFESYSFSVLHHYKHQSETNIKSYTTINKDLGELYLQNSFTVFKQVYNNITRKTYQGIKFTAYTVPHFISELAYQANLSQCISFPKIFQKAKQSIYQSLYRRQALSYVLKLKSYIGEEKPYETNYLLKSFALAQSQTFLGYDKIHQNMIYGSKNCELKDVFQKKLQKYIEEKEQSILSANSKKNATQIKKCMNQNSNNKFQPIQQLQSLIKTQKLVTKQYDQNCQTDVIGQKIKKMYLASNIIKCQQNKLKQTLNNNVNEKKSILNTILQSKFKTKLQDEKEIQKINENNLNMDTKISKMKVAVQKLQKQVKASHLQYEKRMVEDEYSNLEKKLKNKKIQFGNEKNMEVEKPSRQSFLQGQLQRKREERNKLQAYFQSNEKSKSSRSNFRFAEMRRHQESKASLTRRSEL